MLPLLLALLACDATDTDSEAAGVSPAPSAVLQSESAICSTTNVVEFDVGVGAMVQLWTCPDETFCYPMSDPLMDIDSETGILTVGCSGTTHIEARWISA